jgi:hypothetical protein
MKYDFVVIYLIIYLYLTRLHYFILRSELYPLGFYIYDLCSFERWVLVTTYRKLSNCECVVRVCKFINTGLFTGSGQWLLPFGNKHKVSETKFDSEFEICVPPRAGLVVLVHWWPLWRRVLESSVACNPDFHFTFGCALPIFQTRWHSYWNVFITVCVWLCYGRVYDHPFVKHLEL